MSTKPKKPKARRMWMSHMSGAIQQHRDVLTIPGKAIPVAVLDVSDEAALIEVVAKGLHGNDESNLGWGWENMGEDIQSIYKDDARAALTALGVLPKRRGEA